MTRQTSLTARGYAKINLHLDITGRRADGYHTVNTVMQTVSLCDEISLTLLEDDRIFATCNQEGVPQDEKNLAVRAALLFRKTLEKPFGVRINIFKQIPMAAGLAGGSADAAATLVGLNRLFGEPYSNEELCRMGAQLGADVPFCIVGGTCFADGKGDVLHEFPNMPDCAIVIACEGEGVSTPWAYGLLDRKYENFENGYLPKGTDPLKYALFEKNLTRVARSLYNIFEEPILTERPVVAELRELFLAHGALGAMMSGSGPSVFGIFASKSDADGVIDELALRGYHSYVCHPTKI